MPRFTVKFIVPVLISDKMEQGLEAQFFALADK
jgi:hypothetical protein